MSIIANTGNPQYYETRAIEAILQSAEVPNNQRNDHLRQAIGLLLLSLAYREVQDGQNQEDLQSGSGNPGESGK